MALLCTFTLLSLFFILTIQLLIKGNCHGMTFLNLSFPLFAPLFYYSWTSFLSFAYLHTSDIRKAKPKGIHWTQTTRKNHLLLMGSWHLPPVNDVTTVPQLLHAIGLVPVYHNLKAG